MGVFMDEMGKNVMAPENGAQIKMDNGGKNPKDWIKYMIPAAVCVVLVLILVCVAAVTGVFGVFGSKNEVIIKAAGKTFTESAKAIGDVWLMDGYEDMLVEKQAYMEADLTLVDSMQVGMEINADQESTSAHLDIGYYGFSFLEADLYVDENEILLGAPGLIDKVFYVNRTTFDEDIERIAAENNLDESFAEYLKSINMGGRDVDNTNEEMKAAGQQIMDAVVDMLNKVEVKKADSKKLTVDGTERNCKGYVLTITGQQAADVFLTCKDVYESNETFQNYLNEMLMGMEGYSSVEELLKYENPADVLQDCADELAQEGDTDIYFYVYKGVLAQVYSEEEDVVLEWNIMGGNFPLENMKFCLLSDSTDFVFTRTGSMNGNQYAADYELEVDGDEIQLAVERDKKKGDFRFELTYGYDEALLEGTIKENKPGVEFTVDIDTFEIDGEEILRGDIFFSNAYEEEIVKPEGEKVNVMDLSEDDWYDILWEISENLYY